MNLIFFGTSSFAIPALEKLAASPMRPLLVVSTPDRARGRHLAISPTPVKAWAQKNNIPVIMPEKLNGKSILSVLKEKNPDLFVIASYGKIIPKEILDIPLKGTINIHPSLLPKLRGPSPIQTAILENTGTGVTLILTDEEVDHGPILKSSNVKAQMSKVTCKELEQKLAGLGAEMLIEVIPKWMNGEIEPKEQDHAKATFTKKMRKSDGHINWEEPAEIIERKIRTFNPWPGTYAFCEREGKKIRLLILEGEVIEPENEQPAGTVYQSDNSALAVATSKNSLLIKKIKPEGKKEMTGKELLRGYTDLQGRILT